MDKKIEKPATPGILSNTEFAHLGGGELAYIKEMTSDKAQELFPTLNDIPDEVKIYAVHAADGTPIALADTRSAAVGNAMEQNLHPVSIH